MTVFEIEVTSTAFVEITADSVAAANEQLTRKIDDDDSYPLYYADSFKDDVPWHIVDTYEVR